MELRPLAAVCLAVAAFAAPASGAAVDTTRAQTADPAAPFTAELEVRQVELEVTVTDAHGAPLRGLGRDDFRLFEDGEPVVIQHLSELGDAAAAQPATERPGVDGDVAPTHLVIFLDELHTSPGRRVELYRQLGEGLATRLPKGARVMVARYEGGLQVILPFTVRGAAVAGTLEQATNFLSAQAMRGDSERVSVLDSIREDAREGPCLHGDELARQYGERLRADAQQLLRTLDGMVGALDTVPGRKALLYVGDGVPPRPGEEALEFYIEMCTGEGLARGQQEAKDTSTFAEGTRYHRPDPEKLRLESASYDMGDDWQRLAARANGVGVPLHSLVLRTGASSSAAIEANERGPSNVVTAGSALAAGDVGALLADETGGRVLVADGSIARQVDAVLAPRQGYLLGFAAPNPENPRPRRMRVEVTRPGAKVHHRLSYTPVGGVWKVVDRLLAALYLGAGENPLQISVVVEAARGEAPAKVRLQLPLERLTLVPSGDAVQGRFTVFVVTRDATGSLSPVRERAVPVRLPAGALAAAQQRDFVYEVALPAATVPREVAVGVRDEVSGEIAFVRAAL